MNMGIYKITNKTNGKFYIGSSANMRKRWLGHHLPALRKGSHPNAHLQSAFRKVGETAFEFSVIEVVNDHDILIEREQWYLDTSGCLDREIGYNIYPTANGSKHSEETKRKMSLAQMGNTKKLGHKDSDETKKKKSEARKGIVFSEEHKAKISQSKKGKTATAETRAKMAEGARKMWLRRKGLA